ncbi:hypothetical protein BB8028_0001g12310 [Beauveria bassiana]|uniref:AB hydrolase-1 domain-containing protein n=1 Tax=Beauveria bassiana TaxID=176275 RepID=A0A2S7XZ48_BEABA|nr:hypothetical protein BB8028_0001g12310 [Beauveria bassiana]
MAATTTVEVPHLGGITAGYHIANNVIDPNKPTVVLINSACTTSSLFTAQFQSMSLMETTNLIAIEPLGHGATVCASEHYTCWDSAIMTLQTLDVLGIKRVFALGTSQGGWIAARMALLAPQRLQGIVLLGTSMDSESSLRSDDVSWELKANLIPLYESWCSMTATPHFVPDEHWRRMVVNVGFSGSVPDDFSSFWHKTLKTVYSGDEGRKKLRIAILCLLERDSILLRLRDIRCPVYWLQGSSDPVFGRVMPEQHIQLFTSAPETKLTFIDGGGHYLNVTHPEEVNFALLNMVEKYAWASSRVITQ